MGRRQSGSLEPIAAQEVRRCVPPRLSAFPVAIPLQPPASRANPHCNTFLSWSVLRAPCSDATAPISCTLTCTSTCTSMRTSTPALVQRAPAPEPPPTPTAGPLTSGLTSVWTRALKTEPCADATPAVLSHFSAVCFPTVADPNPNSQRTEARVKQEPSEPQTAGGTVHLDEQTIAARFPLATESRHLEERMLTEYLYGVHYMIQV